MSTSGTLNRKLADTIRGWADPPRSQGAARDKRWLGDVALGLSLMNLWLLPLWKHVLLYSPVSSASMTGDPSATLYLAAVLLLGTGAVLFALAAAAVRAIGREELTRPARIGFILGVMVLVRWEFIVPIVLAALIIAAYVGAKKLGLVLRAVRLIVLLFVPFALGVVAQLLVKAVQAERAGNYAQAVPHSTTRVPRAVVSICDGLDNRVLMPNDSGFVTPAFNALRAQSFAANAAESPSASTSNSLPTVIQGKYIVHADDPGFAYTRLHPSGTNGPVLWKDAKPNLFTVARERRLNAAVAGWYHAYCGIFGNILVRCYNYSYYGLPIGTGVLSTAAEL